MSYVALTAGKLLVSLLELTARYQWRLVFFFNETATTEIYTLSLHDALPISARASRLKRRRRKPPRLQSSSTAAVEPLNGLKPGGPVVGSALHMVRRALMTASFGLLVMTTACSGAFFANVPSPSPVTAASVRAAVDKSDMLNAHFRATGTLGVQGNHYTI